MIARTIMIIATRNNSRQFSFIQTYEREANGKASKSDADECVCVCKRKEDKMCRRNIEWKLSLLSPFVISTTATVVAAIGACNGNGKVIV